MCDEWMPTIQLPLSMEEFYQLPRNSAYKYEYFDGHVWLSPRPRHYHALLDLATFTPAIEDAPLDRVALRPARESDFTDLISLFAATFRRIQPFGSLDDETRKKAAKKSLDRTHSGGDGPWIAKASFVAMKDETEAPVGAILITLLPDGDPCSTDSYYWDAPPPADCIEQGMGRPHLTWVFVSPSCAGHGIGTVLLTSAIRELRALGYEQMLSTFMIGNDSSMLWHWRNGFRLLPYPHSQREMKQRFSK